MTRMTLGDFESRYRSERDPWSYESSDYEHAKYAETLSACGEGPFMSGLELGCSIGVFTALLAPRCRRLTAVDAAPTAIEIARRRLAGQRRVRLLLAEIPGGVPPLSYDLVVASEILYYLSEEALERTLDLIRRRLIAGGTLVAVHWRPAGAERVFTAADVHGLLQEQPWLQRLRHDVNHDYLLDAWARR